MTEGIAHIIIQKRGADDAAGCWPVKLRCGSITAALGAMSGSFELSSQQRSTLPATPPDQYGRILYRGLSSEVVARLGEARGEYDHLRLRIEIDAPELTSLRWEYLQLPVDGQWEFAALSARCTLCRRVAASASQDHKPRPFHSSRTLLAISNPNWNQCEDADAIEQAEFTRLVTLPNVTLVPGPSCTTDAIIAAIGASPCDILILLAHGCIEAGKRCIVFSTAAREPVLVPVSDFVSAFKRIPHPPCLAVLVVCGSGYEDARPRTDAGTQLVGGSAIPAAIAMAGDLTVASAKLWLVALIAELRRTGDIDRAMTAARRALDDAHRQDTFVPVLVLRKWADLFDVTDPNAISADRLAASGTAPQQPSLPVTPLPAADRGAETPRIVMPRRRRIAIGAAVVTLAVLFVGGWWWKHGGERADVPSMAHTATAAEPWSDRAIAFELAPPPVTRPIEHSVTCDDRLRAARTTSERLIAMRSCESNRTAGAALCAKLDAARAASWLQVPLQASDVTALAPLLLPCFPQQGVDALAAVPWTNTSTECRLLVEAQAPCRENRKTGCEILESRAAEIPGCKTMNATVKIDFEPGLTVYIDNYPVESNKERTLTLRKSDRVAYHLLVNRSGTRVLTEDVPITEGANQFYFIRWVTLGVRGPGKISGRRWRDRQATPLPECETKQSCALRLVPSDVLEFELDAAHRDTPWGCGRCRGAAGVCKVEAFDGSIALTADVNATSTLTIAPATNGNIEEVVTACDGSETRIAAASGPRRQGAEVVLAATPDAAHGFHLKTWLDVCSHAQERCRFTMPGSDRKVSAVFVDQVEVTFVIADGAAPPVRHRVDRGDCHELLATPKDATWTVEWTVSPKGELEECADPGKSPACRCVRAVVDATVTARFTPPRPVNQLVPGSASSPDAME